MKDEGRETTVKAKRKQWLSQWLCFAFADH